MRLTVPHSLWRSNCSPLIFGFVESNSTKLHPRFPRPLKAERLVVLLNRQPTKQPVNKSKTSSEIINHDSDSHLALLVAPASKVPFLLRGCGFTETESPASHRSFIWIVGLAVSLVSLGALRLFDFFDWLSKLTLSKDAPVVGLERNMNPANGSWSGLSWTPYTTVDVDQPDRSRSSVNALAQSDRFSTASWASSQTSDYWKSASINRANSSVYVNSTAGRRVENAEVQGSDPMLSLFYQSPLRTVNASLNCPHFNQGINQLCMICWLNSPAQWVFGPTLGPLDRSIFACLDQLANMDLKPGSCEAAAAAAAVGLIAASALLTRASDADAVGRWPTRAAWQHVLMRNAQASPDTDAPQPALPPRKRVLSSDRLERLSPAQSFPKMARSSGDGAPSASPSDAYTTSAAAATLKSKALPDELLQSELLSSPYAGLSRNTTSRPVFYTYDSDLDASPATSPSPTRRKTPATPEQLRLSANRVLSKALELLGAKAAPVPNDSPAANSAPSLVISPSSPRAVLRSHGRISRTGSADSHSVASDHSLHSLASDGFEYDEMYTSNSHLVDHSNSFLLDPAEEERLRQEEEAQLLHLLGTLTSLLDQKVGEASSVDPAATSDHTKSTPVVSPSKAANAPFTDLFQSASDITEDLQHLEEVLDQLRYKLQANQIELEQAEDKLDYAWHLHDHLDGSDASSLSCDQSLAGSCASLASAGSATRDPTAVSRLTDSQSPPVRGTPSEPVESDRQSCQNSQFLSPTDWLRTDSLYTSFTSSCMTTMTVSVEPESTIDSAYEQSVSTCPYVMTTSVPDARLTDVPSMRDDETFYQGSNTLDRPRSRRLRSYSRRSYVPHRRSLFHADRTAPKLVDSGSPPSDQEDLLDPDGFLHPEMTFDKDGTIDWSESGEVMR